MAQFDDSRDAQRALREVKKVMSRRQVAVREGAVIVHDVDGELHVHDVKEIGLSDIVRGATDLSMALGRGGFSLTMRLMGGAVGLAADGIRLALPGTWRAAMLTGAILAAPGRK